MGTNQTFSTQPNPMPRSYRKQTKTTKEVERPLQLSCSLPSNHAMMEVDCFIQHGLAGLGHIELKQVYTPEIETKNGHVLIRIINLG